MLEAGTDEAFVAHHDATRRHLGQTVFMYAEG